MRLAAAHGGPIYDLSLRPASDSEDGAVEGHMQRRPKRASVNDARFAAVIAVLRQKVGPEMSMHLRAVFVSSGLT